MSIAISILQKYSSNQESATQTYDDDQNFNTTKVLFKHDITAYTFYKAIIFQYYKSTLQTWSQLSFFNSSLTYFNTTKVLFKQGVGKGAGGVGEGDFNTTKVLFKL